MQRTTHTKLESPDEQVDPHILFARGNETTEANFRKETTRYTKECNIKCRQKTIFLKT